MVQPEQITSGHREKPQRWQPERKGANELKHFAFLWGMWPRFFIEKKRDRGKVGVESTTFFPQANDSKSSNMHPASIIPKMESFLRNRHNGADIVNWQVEKGGFGWK